MKRIAALTALLLFLFAPAGCSWLPDTTEPDIPETPDTLETPPASEPPEVVVPSSASEPPSQPQSSKLDRIPFADHHLYAVACLGYEGADGLSSYAEQYLEHSDLPFHNISGGEYYLIIPRYSDMTIRLYRNSMETMEQTLFYENENSHPFLVRCNISDIFPDLTVQLTYQGETVEFSPYISLKDGSVMVGERGLDLTGSS